MDTGANVNVLADKPYGVMFPYEKSTMKAMVANGSVVSAPNMLRLRDVHTPDQDSLFYQIQNAQNTLFSNSDHALKGFEFFLSGRRGSIMWTPDKREIIIPLVKESKNQKPLWKIVLTVDKDGNSSYESMPSIGDYQPYTRSAELPVLDHLPATTVSDQSLGLLGETSQAQSVAVDTSDEGCTPFVFPSARVYTAVINCVDTTDVVADGSIPYEAVYSDGIDPGTPLAVANRAFGGLKGTMPRNRYAILHGENLIASRGFPSQETARLSNFSPRLLGQFKIPR